MPTDVPHPAQAAPARAHLARPLLVLLVVTLTACSLAPGPAPVARHFAPRPPDVTPADAGAYAGPIGLRQVTASTHLTQRLAWRSSDVEYGYHEYRRWTEPPQDYVHDVLERVLFQSGRFSRAPRTGSPILGVHLHTFEEVYGPDGRGVELELSVLLERADGSFLLDRRYRRRDGVAGDDPAEVARALGRLLAQVIGEIVDEVADALAAEQG